MAFPSIDIFTTYYNNKSSANPGKNPAINGNCNKELGYYEIQYHGNRPVKVWANVLANCVGYAVGRYHQVIGDSSFKTFPYAGNAGKFVDNAPKYGLKVGKTPKAGAIICWKLPGSYGHVAFVERVVSDSEIIISESGWSYWSAYKVPYYTGITLKKGSNGNWTSGTMSTGRGYWMSSNYRFQGFIYSPNNFANDPIGIGASVGADIASSIIDGAAS